LTEYQGIGIFIDASETGGVHSYVVEVFFDNRYVRNKR